MVDALRELEVQLRVVEVRLLDADVDPPDGVDHLAETADVDLHVMVDRQSRQRPDRIDHPLSAVGVSAVYLRVELAAPSVDGHVEVAGQMEQNAALLAGDDLREDDRVGPLAAHAAEPRDVLRVGEPLARVTTDEKDVQ